MGFGKRLAIASVVIGLLGIVTYFVTKGLRREKVEPEPEQVEQTETREQDRNLKIEPMSATITAGSEAEFRVSIVDREGELTEADSEVVLIIRPAPETRSYRYYTEDGSGASIKKGESSVKFKYTETKSGRYTVTVESDFDTVKFQITIDPDLMTSLSINGPDTITINEAKDGFIMKAVATDKYGNVITSGFTWVVQKNQGSEQTPGAGAEVEFYDPVAAPCDRYRFVVGREGKTAVKTVTVIEPGGSC